MGKRAIRPGLGLAIVAVLSTFFVSYASAASYWSGNWGYVAQDSTACYWARAHLRIPSNNATADLDFNTFVYKEPANSCNKAAPFSNALYNNMGLQAQLFHFNSATWCAQTSWRIVPNGSTTPYGWGQAFKRAGSGVCATGQLISYAYANVTQQSSNAIRDQVVTP